MMIFWGILIGLPLLIFGGALLFSPTKVGEYARALNKNKYLRVILVSAAWIWATYEIMTFGVNIFREFFVGVPLLRQLMLCLAFFYDHFWLLTPFLIYFTLIWMPKSLTMRAITGLLMLLPSALFKTTRVLVPESGFALIQLFVVVAYIGAIIGMYGMFYPWKLESALRRVLSAPLFARALGFVSASLALALIAISFI